MTKENEVDPIKGQVLATLLRHENCGGFFEHASTRGLSVHGFLCSKCKAWMYVDYGEEYAQQQREDRERRSEEHRKWVAEHPYVPPTPIREATPDEAKLLEQYRDWSESHYAAGFMDPDATTVSEFIEYMEGEHGPTHIYDQYELDFLNEYAKQKQERLEDSNADNRD